MRSNEHATRVFQCMGTTTEIRWGERMAIDLPVRIVRRGASPVAGRLRNLSISGALIETEVAFERCAPLTIALTVPAHGDAQGSEDLQLEAVVARTSDGAIGIEWRDMACQPLVELFHQPHRG